MKISQISGKRAFLECVQYYGHSIRSYAAVINSFVSTRNEVFVIKALATSQEALKTLAPAIASVTIHKFDTKTAIASNNTTQSNGYTIQSINATYYVTADVLMVRSGAGETYPEIGRLSYGDAVQVKGKVMNNGMDTNWYLISYNGMDGYTSSQFYSATALNNGANPSAAQSTANDSSSYVCDQCGQTFLTKGDLARHLTDVHNVSDGDIDTTGLAQCPFCLSWFNEGTDFRNHVMAAHPDKNANSPEWNDVEENYEKDYEEEEDYE